MMLRIYNSKSADLAKSYYVKAASKEAYYSEGQEFTGFWGGRAAALLGLDGRVSEEAFSRLCENRHPVTGKKLTVRMNENRTVGFDLNWNCPKSVSIVYAWTKDERIIKAFRQAVRDTMEEIEQAAATRQRASLDKQADQNRITGNLVWAEFIHLTARPEGGIPDPHLHAHCFVPNVTFDPVEKKWKALQMYEIHREANYYNGAVTMRLAENLKAIGLEIETGETSFEIAGVSRELIERFSKRSGRIAAEAERRGITNPAEKHKLGALTRENKAKTLLMPELEKVWFTDLPKTEQTALRGIETLLRHSRATEMSQQIAGEPTGNAPATPEIERSADLLGKRKSVKPQKTERRMSLNWMTEPERTVAGEVEPTDHDRRAVLLAMEHLFERRSVVTEKQLMAEAFRSWCVGRATYAGVRRVVGEMPLIRVETESSTLVTTWEVMAEENRIIDRCKNGKWKFAALNRSWRIHDEKLNEEQRDAVEHVLTSQDWIVGISGKAGTGKTTLLHEARRGIEASGRKLLVLAPTAVASRDTLRKDGFENAETVAKLIENKWLQKQAQGAVIWVDEAGLLSTRQMDRLLTVAEKLDARVVLAGDTGQNHAVERGQAFDLLQRRGELTVAVVEDVLRQEGEYRTYAMNLGAGNVDEAIESLYKMNSLHEMPVEERGKVLAEKYLATLAAGETAQIVSPTHKECDHINEAIRSGMKEKGLLGHGEERKVLRNLSWTKAQKRDGEHYRPGLVVEINGRVPGFEVGERLTVVEANINGVLARGSNGIKELPLGSPETFSVHQWNRIELAEGDNIRITANGYKEGEQHLTNGSQHFIKKINEDGSLILEDGVLVNPDFVHIAHSYSITPYAAQGKTVDRVFVAQSPELSDETGDLKQFYTSTTRGRLSVDVFTTDIEQLIANIQCERERLMATDILAADFGRKEMIAEKAQAVGPAQAEVKKLSDRLRELENDYRQAERAAAREKDDLTAAQAPEKEIEVGDGRAKSSKMLGEQNEHLDKATAERLEQSIVTSPPAHEPAQSEMSRGPAIEMVMEM